MLINFFKAACEKSTDDLKFGLCDDLDVFPDETPAYIDNIDKSKWIAQVLNPDSKLVTFTAIDHCIENIVRADGKDDNKCDCMLTYKDSITFVELKNRKSGGWVTEGLNQLAVTIAHFKSNNSLDQYPMRRAHIANNLNPQFSNSYRGIIQKFKNDTGFNLNIKKDIEI